MKTVKDVFTQYLKELKPLYGEQEANSITALLLRGLTGLNKAKLKAFPETVLPEEQLDQIKEALEKLKTGMPLQYIIGTTEFYGLTFRVNQSVLIPRPETEELVEWIINTVKQSGLTSGSILDIGTGSGCIAIALKNKLSAFKVSAVDISDSALETAKQNAVLNNVEVDFIKADILDPESIRLFDTRFDIIVSNPPYVTLDDKEQMHVNVTEFEPHTALFVPEHDPLVFYRHIAGLASRLLNPRGGLFFEINESLGEETLDLIDDKQFTNKELRKDFRDRERMIRALKVN